MQLFYFLLEHCFLLVIVGRLLLPPIRLVIIASPRPLFFAGLAFEGCPGIFQFQLGSLHDASIMDGRDGQDEECQCQEAEKDVFDGEAARGE